MVTFNSLSRDHAVRRCRCGQKRGRASFNSLSRDHQRGSAFVACRLWIELSTPSLGITVRLNGEKRSSTITSLDRTFNSLSRDHCFSAARETILLRPLSTPSLGITKLVPEFAIEADQDAFNSLSRDHRALFRDFPALRGFPPRHPFAHLYFPATI